MLFRNKSRQGAGNSGAQKDLYPILYVIDSLKQYHTDLVNKEVQSLQELSLIGSSFDTVLG